MPRKDLECIDTRDKNGVPDKGSLAKACCEWFGKKGKKQKWSSLFCCISFELVWC